MAYPWIIISVATLIVLLAVAMVLLRKREKTPPDYYNFFIMGIIWLCVGIPLDNFALSGLGAIFMIVGIVHKDEWKANRRSWKHLKADERRIVSIIMGLLALMVIAGLVLLLAGSRGGI